MKNDVVVVVVKGRNRLWVEVFAKAALAVEYREIIDGSIPSTRFYRHVLMKDRPLREHHNRNDVYVFVHNYPPSSGEIDDLPVVEVFDTLENAEYFRTMQGNQGDIYERTVKSDEPHSFFPVKPNEPGKLNLV